jgi:hypothetical protein
VDAEVEAVEAWCNGEEVEAVCVWGGAWMEGDGGLPGVGAPQKGVRCAGGAEVEEEMAWLGEWFHTNFEGRIRCAFDRDAEVRHGRELKLLTPFVRECARAMQGSVIVMGELDGSDAATLVVSSPGHFIPK